MKKRGASIQLGHKRKPPHDEEAGGRKVVARGAEMVPDAVAIPSDYEAIGSIGSGCYRRPHRGGAQ